MLAENYIIDRIESLCEKKQISRYRLSQKTGLAQSSISNLLNRKSIPTIPTLEKICEGLGVTLAQFFAGEGETPDLTGEQKELLAVWNDLSDEEKKLTRAYMQGISKK
ncbi:MAG: helix-turn-helix transcriptional regulator [Muribaculaceae bacterium]|nr:helix-turn-helix transcriptional regulator [Muribaculaceae bacterium]